MMANERVGEDDAEAILSNLKMEGRCLAKEMRMFMWYGRRLHINSGISLAG